MHFAVDEQEVRFCTHLSGKGSWFLPFNLGWIYGAGNPPNPNGLQPALDKLRYRRPRGLSALAVASRDWNRVRPAGSATDWSASF